MLSHIFVYAVLQITKIFLYPIFEIVVNMSKSEDSSKGPVVLKCLAYSTVVYIKKTL